MLYGAVLVVTREPIQAGQTNCVVVQVHLQLSLLGLLSRNLGLLSRNLGLLSSRNVGLLFGAGRQVRQQG
jgi:hypothetical protein